MLTSSPGEEEGCLELVCPSSPGEGGLQTYSPYLPDVGTCWSTEGLEADLLQGWHLVGMPIQSFMASCLFRTGNVEDSLGLYS